MGWPLAFVLSWQPTRFEAVAAIEELEATLAQLRALGYAGVELAVRDPATVPASPLRALLERYGLRVPAIGTGQAWVEEGLSLTHPDAAVRRAALARLEAHLELAAEWGSLVIIGLIRGRLMAGVDRAQALEWLSEAIARLADRAAYPVRLALEPLNRYETDLLNTVEEALSLIERVGRSQVGVLLDTFHANIEEASLERAIARAGDRLFHVHIADSNRRAPGWGHLDFESVLKALREAGYRGWLSAEVLPQPSLEEAMAQVARWARIALNRSPK
ncbi:5-keto-L-gluconate epimerase [Thermoflexus sp.]|uniref:5-keto-L-gluconate epimerase n=1 Tax=Thermoflexus sp. TaxID=1969742 RepID=UPI001761773F|nr:5-keto-L-gluconate epimerase [Thermoflexus sp.]